MTRNFPESEESWKGHGRKTKSRLQSRKKAPQQELAGALTTSNVKASEKDVYHKVYNLHDDLERKIYTKKNMDRYDFHGTPNSLRCLARACFLISWTSFQ